MAEAPEDAVLPGSKRRRLRGSCDTCKQRKIRCDSSQMPGRKCTNCIAFNSECTHASKSVPAKTQKFKQPAPTQNEMHMEAINTARDHVAAIVLQATTYIPQSDLRRVLLDVARYARDLEKQLDSRKPSPSLPASSTHSPGPSGDQEQEAHSDYVLLHGVLTEKFERFSLECDASRYFGKSSHFQLINTAMGIQERCTQLEGPETRPPPARRPEYWFSPWEYEHLAIEAEYQPLIFPETTLLQKLIDVFFSKVNILICLLHRPTFERSVASGFHLTDFQFGCTVSAVCAVAAKYSDDPRVVFPGTNDSSLSSGWAYFKQLPLLQKPFARACTLYEAQTICLSVFYLQGSSKPEACWTLGGAGIRFAQEVGAHRRNRFEDRIEAEQWKRVFWMLIWIDTLSSSFNGRPRGTHASDYNLEFPVDCDDEYWEADDPADAFKQPLGKPSVTSYAISYCKLIEIIGMAQRTIYEENPKSSGDEWTKEVIANLDSAMNDWIDQVPMHPHMVDPVFATQSAVLYACYYHVQIQIHRIFVNCPNMGNGASAYASLAICTSSARACSHVMDVATKRGSLTNPYLLNAVFDSALLLLLNVWGGRYVGITVDPQKCMQDVEMCMRVLQVYEPRWHVAGRHHDIISEFMNAASVNLSFASNPRKRRFETEPSTSSSASFVPLPMHSQDLSRLPVYESVNWGKSLRPDEEILLPPDIQTIMSNEESLLPEAIDLNATLLSGAPIGYDWNDWEKYLASVEELMKTHS